MKEHKLDECIESIKKIFGRETNMYEAHRKSQRILLQMSADDEVIHKIYRNKILLEKFNHQSPTPDFQMNIIDLPYCSLFVSFFGPNKEQNTEITYSTLHTHGDYLLTSIGAKGPGYKSLIFNKGFNVNPDTKEVEMKLKKFTTHVLSNVEFIEEESAHTLFFPESLSMTYALWSNRHPVSRIARLKSSKIIQKNKTWIKSLIKKASVNVESIGIPQYREDYFYPENGKIKSLPGQIYPVDGHNFIQNYFHILQFSGFRDMEFLKKLLPNLEMQNKKDVRMWMEKFIEGEVIERNYDSYAMYTPNRNVPIEEFRKCYDFKLEK